jgi:hypothetical protein
MQAVSAQLRKPLGELLLDRGYLRPEQLQRALEEQRASGGRKLLGEILIGMKLVGEDQIAEVLAQSYGVPFAKISPRLADPKVIPILPREFLLKHTVLPLFLVESVLTVAVAEPTDLFLQEELSRFRSSRAPPGTSARRWKPTCPTIRFSSLTRSSKKSDPKSSRSSKNKRRTSPPSKPRRRIRRW